MYHGTNLTHWNNIKKNGIKPIGGGTLLKGFYFTPSIRRASNYFKFTGGYSKVIIELIIKDASQLTVGRFERGSTGVETDPIITQTFTSPRIWQFIVRDQKIIDKHFKIHRIFIVK
jgi:hypothetical protein